MSKTLSFTNQKGGVGKTTSAVNVALSLAVSEVKTLLIDLDPQSNASTGLSDLIKDKRGNVYDVMLRSESINDVVTTTSFDHLDIIISTNDLVGAEIELVGVMAREYQLQKRRQKKLLRKRLLQRKQLLKRNLLRKLLLLKKKPANSFLIILI